MFKFSHTHLAISRCSSSKDLANLILASFRQHNRNCFVLTLYSKNSVEGLGRPPFDVLDNAVALWFRYQAVSVMCIQNVIYRDDSTFFRNFYSSAKNVPRWPVEKLELVSVAITTINTSHTSNPTIYKGLKAFWLSNWSNIARVAAFLFEVSLVLPVLAL